MRTLVAVSTGAAVVAGTAYLLSNRLGWNVPWLFGSEGWKVVGEVSSLHVHPIKSCRGTEVDVLELDMYGAVQDRRFMIVDEEGRFITQRQESVMCRISAELRPDGYVMLSMAERAWSTTRLGQGNTVQCIFKPVSVVSAANPQVEVGVWDDNVLAVDQGQEVSKWLQNILGRPARLVGMTPAFDRPTSRKYTPRSCLGQAAFSDGFPLLLISEASLGDLNARMTTPLPKNRFRPNIWVKGCDAYAEDRWRTLRIGDNILHVVKPCSRCKVTTTDQDTGYRGEEPLTTLATYRKKHDVKAPCGDKVDVFFGQNLCHESGAGSLYKGDVVFARYWQYPWGYWHFC